MDMAKVLMTLSSACGVSGSERGAVEAAKTLLEPLVDTVEITPMGNLLGRRNSAKAGAKTLLLDAHLDEVGLLVSGRAENLLRITDGVGGVDSRLLPGTVVKVLTDPPIPGVVTVPEEPKEKTKPFPLEGMFIDCGLTADTEVPVGTPVSYGTQPFRAGEDRVFGKSLDNRACFAALLRALELAREEDLPVNVAVLGSVQEERGGLGAQTGTFALHPDAALVVDVTFGDSPDTPKDHGMPLGSGAAIGYSPVLDRTYTKTLKSLADAYKIPYTREVMEGGTGTNSMHTQIAGTGVPTALISLPLRYMHTPVEEISLTDLESMARLVAEFIKHFGEDAQC